MLHWEISLGPVRLSNDYRFNIAFLGVTTKSLVATPEAAR
jgi:hypothetical protein